MLRLFGAVAGKLKGPWPLATPQLKLLGRALLNLFYPLRCSACDSDLPYNSLSKICSPCLASLKSIPQEPSLLFIRSCLLYEGTTQELIRQFKYLGKDYLSEFWVHFLLKEWLHFAEMRTADILTSVPSHPIRLRERGYNQAQVLARSLAQAVGRPYLPLLKRVRYTPSQTHLKKEERAKNIKSAFQALDSASLKGKRVLLVDDVCTTGATLNECAKTLRRAGSGKVFSLTIARQEF